MVSPRENLIIVIYPKGKKTNTPQPIFEGTKSQARRLLPCSAEGLAYIVKENAEKAKLKQSHEQQEKNNALNGSNLVSLPLSHICMMQPTKSSYDIDFPPLREFHKDHCRNMPKNPNPTNKDEKGNQKKFLL